MRLGPNIKTEEPYRISRDKMNVLARAVAETLAGVEDVTFVEDKNSIRQEVRRILEELGLTVATPADARHMLKLKGGNNVNF